MEMDPESRPTELNLSRWWVGKDPYGIGGGMLIHWW